MLDDEHTVDHANQPTSTVGDPAAGPPARPRRKRAAASASGDATPAAARSGGSDQPETGEPEAGDTKPAARRSRRKSNKAPVEGETTAPEAPDVVPAERPAKRTRRKAVEDTGAATRPAEDGSPTSASTTAAEAGGVPAVVFQPPPESDVTPPAEPTRRRRARRGGRGKGGGAGDDNAAASRAAAPEESAEAAAIEAAPDTESGPGAEGIEPVETEAGTRRRRRRRRRRSTGDETDPGAVDDEGVETVVHVREPRGKTTAAKPDESVRGVTGSTRLEAKRQRRREGRDTGRRRPPIITEAEFLARREAVERVMVVRQGEQRTQIGVVEDDLLVEHYVARKDYTSMVGNVYLGKVQNVLPSMEAAFVDIGRGRNAVLYAGEVNYDASTLEGRPPRIEQVLKSGQSVLVQVTKDPLGHKGARLTSQVSLPGRFMVYVPDGRLSGISRKLPDTERTRLKGILKRLTPDDAGVIIRTAAEGASEEELERDLKRLHAQWQDIEKKAESANAPALIYGEPDVVIRVIRDIFNEDFKELVVEGDDEWDTVDNYIRWVAPDLAERAHKWTGDKDVFTAYRIDEQLAKALDRKVWLPSGGYLIIDRTEAMVVIDVNTGKFTGKGGGNLEETVTKNNLEAAEEIVRQLRLRDLGGIIVIDFIDMVLESNRDLVLRRLVECLGRDRTRHQVAEVTSLGLVQMTRKRVGQGLLEAFSEPCRECNGRGVKVTLDPVADRRLARAAAATGGEGRKATDDQPADGEVGERTKRRSRRRGGAAGGEASGAQAAEPVAAAGAD